MLTRLSCGDNQLSNLDVTKNIELQDLSCSENLIAVLDLTNNTKLTYLHCAYNQLTSLDISKNVLLGMLACWNQEATVTVSEKNAFDLNTLPGAFDISKASEWEGGIVNGNILTFLKDTVTYVYDIGLEGSTIITLYASNYNANIGDAPSTESPAPTSPSPSNPQPSTQTPAQQNPSIPTTTEKVSAGATVTDVKSKSVYKVAGNATSGYTVTYVRPTSQKAKSVTIPATVTVNGVSCKVTSIANNAFKGQKKLKKVTIGANVTTIGKKAFSGCKSLKKVVVKSKKLKKVGAKAFANINPKAKIKVPKNKKKAYKKLFKKNTGVKSSML